ncbi:MAG: cell division protein ZipA C-terminal FtsZ-binding domain-containing protein [Gammaproteobacteria bacterium]|jgi:FtsZ-interacting cell division protein ZipA|tara:strand:- start:138 stop:770 length:633 start_codon:yes stop_codon:yes gene_type:complete
MGINAEIYLIGLSVLTFLIIVFLFIKKISNSGKLKVKIEKVSDSTNHQSFDEGAKQATLKFDDGQSEKIEDQELVILNLISVDKSFFDVDQIIGFLSNYGAVLNNKYFSYIDEQGTEIFRVANALNPGTFEVDSKTFAVVIASNLSSVADPVNTVKTMIEFSINFSEKFHASLCDEERTPITKQMISHIETRAQDLARLKQLKNVNNKEN